MKVSELDAEIRTQRNTIHQQNKLILKNRQEILDLETKLEETVRKLDEKSVLLENHEINFTNTNPMNEAEGETIEQTEKINEDKVQDVGSMELREGKALLKEREVSLRLREEEVRRQLDRVQPLTPLVEVSCFNPTDMLG